MDVNAEIDTQIDAVLPYLQVSQSFANRVIEENRKKNDDDDETDDDDDDESSNTTNRQPGSNKKNPKDKGKSDEEPAWFKAYREQQDARFAAIEGEKTTTSRKAKLEAVLKDSGTFGTRTLKSFGKMSFENDEEFEEFLSEVTEDLKTYNQERADAGLSTMGTPPAAGGGKPKEDEPFSDNEIDAMADIL